MSSLKRLKDRFRGRSPKPPNESPQRGEAGINNKVISPSHTPAAPTSAKPVESSTADAQLKDSSIQRNLWQEAYDQISEKERDVLSHRRAPDGDVNHQSPTISVVENVIQTTEKRYQEYQEGGLKIRRSSGKDIDIRGSCQKIINAALSFKDVISAVSAFDPTSHAASAWAVVSLGLTVCYITDISIHRMLIPV